MNPDRDRRGSKNSFFPNSTIAGLVNVGRLDLLDRFVALRYGGSCNQKSGGHDGPRGGDSMIVDIPPMTRRLSPTTRRLAHDDLLVDGRGAIDEGFLQRRSR